MSLSDAVTTVLSRNVFYRDGYRLLMRVSLVQGAAIVLLVASIIAMILSMDTRYVYFATTSDGRIINIVPLNEPFRSRGDVVAWAAGRAQDVMRFGYNDFRQRLQASSVNFTAVGWESFTRAMKEARVLEAVEARKLTVSMQIEAAPEVKKALDNKGVYTWHLQFPVVIKFDGAEPPEPMNAMLILQIVRVSTLQNPEGISIEQWIAVPR
ncbi:MAG TPA: type IV secretion protein IcmL [Rhodospirillaceae bacterium]|nr:type IV secretion protein IcmL [Rhodospirillaceae bacterium]